MTEHTRYLAWITVLLCALAWGCGPATQTNDENTCQGKQCADAGVPEAGSLDKKACQPGTDTCRCSPTGGCAEGLRCESGVCRACVAGSAACLCKSGNTCDDGLTCVAGVCRGCVGKAFCSCYANGHCDTGMRCDERSTCQPCEGDNKAGCNCDNDAFCGSGLLCINKHCAAAEEVKSVPKQPKCYTPCQGDILENGKVRTCDLKFRLTEGCGLGQVCLEGSCVATAKSKQLTSSGYPFCKHLTDCPGWQTCLVGRCYSTCTPGAATCGDGMQCHNRVCRKSCEVDKSGSCEKGYACLSTKSDSQKGVCLPISQRKLSLPKTKVHEVFSVAPQDLDLTNHNASGVFAITNRSDFSSSFTITRSFDTIASKQPLFWLKLDRCAKYNSEGTDCTAFEGKPTAEEPFKVTVGPKQTVFLKVVGADGKPKDQKQYEGLFQLQSAETTQSLRVRYRESGTGRWKGEFVTFGNFDTGLIDKFPAPSSLPVKDLSNALLRRWLNFKRNNLSFEQFRALLRSIKEQTWKLDKVRADCKQAFSKVASDDVACYPYTNDTGYEVLSYSQREAAPPSGVSSIDFTMDVKELSGNTFQGRIVSSESLQYPGNPQITLQFAETPGAKPRTLLTSLKAVSDLGGRYLVWEKESCNNPSKMEKVEIPWQLPGFLGSFTKATDVSLKYHECRTKSAPHVVPAGATKEQRAAIERLNLALSAANPIPNGRSLRRTLQLVDGVLIDNRYLFALVKETLVSFFPNQGVKTTLTKDIVRYGYILLQRMDRDVTAEEVVGNPPAQGFGCQTNSECHTGETCQSGVCQGTGMMKQVACTANIVKVAMNRTLGTVDLTSWSTDALKQLVHSLIRGQNPSVSTESANLIVGKRQGTYTDYSYQNQTNQKTHFIHYYCERTGQFNGGPKGGETPCPLGSKVTFFELPEVNTSALAGESCQSTKTCGKRLEELRRVPGFREDVPFRCVDAKQTRCDEESRVDLRSGKVFFKPGNTSNFRSRLQPLSYALTQAFRYRFQFTSRSGSQVGFSPTICKPGVSSQTPYCYDPVGIEEIEQRVNCLESIFSSPAVTKNLDPDTRALLRDTLVEAFSYANGLSQQGQVLTFPGFEMLNAELRVMLGDDSFVKALNNRYQLASEGLVTFRGDILEPNGIKLSGVIGFEMHHLYLSTQYYQSVLDRFYAQSTTFVSSFRSSNTSFLTARSVTSYIQKLLQAATRKARSWGKIATKYHQMNRTDLARHVLERAYVNSFIELNILTHILRSLTNIIDPKQVEQISKEIEKVTLTYNTALFDMKETYQKLERKLDYFGLPQGYIPFPAMDSFATLSNNKNAFSVALEFAKEKLETAREKEQQALLEKRAFDTDAAQFQSELVRVQKSYDTQLARLCGSIKIGDALVPATPQNALLSDTFKGVGDICGKIPGSELYNAYLGLRKAGLEMLQFEQIRKNHEDKITREADRIKTFCDSQFSLSNISWEYEGKRQDVLRSLSLNRVLMMAGMRAASGAMQIALGWKCSVLIGGVFDTECQFAGISNGLKVAIFAAQEAANLALDLKANEAKKSQRALQKQLAKSELRTSCNVCPPEDPDCQTKGVVRINGQHNLSVLALQTASFTLDILQKQLDIQLAKSKVEQLRQKAQRLMNERATALDLLANVQAAQNDPNIRIYKNDTIISAERTFDEAIKEAYRVTLIYEYYTGTSYKDKGNLFLTRMVEKGDLNLETYLLNLEQAFRDFEEQKGKPDVRVAVVSLRNDILKIPMQNKQGEVLSLNERVTELQRQLTSREHLNQEGFASFDFNLKVDGNSQYTSPLTFNHKVVYIEAEVIGGEIGDTVGRVYLRQAGTSSVQLENDELKFYALPVRTAVINTFFNGSKVFPSEIYQNFRFQDRPLGNTRWQLMLNMSTEKANQDINLSSINDIKIYIYYKDFTK
ncbi:MAG: hypothetical protein CL920_18495 [Deltaproteobacteria bacterium]|nr:hypothetical protein [Deltaproteobacteria bacterium]MBU50673.1 hypothetical protein [Deltaproteobacteria bacterium]